MHCQSRRIKLERVGLFSTSARLSLSERERGGMPKPGETPERTDHACHREHPIS